LTVTVALPEALALVTGDLTWTGTVAAGAEVTLEEIVARATDGLAPGVVVRVTASFDDGDGVWQRTVAVTGGRPVYLPLAPNGALPGR
jgi:hypothetical protein